MPKRQHGPMLDQTGRSRSRRRRGTRDIMSRAFVKEQDTEPLDELPERPQSPHPNYVTPSGLAALQAQLHALQEQRHHLLEHPDEDLLSKETLKQVERDLRYFQIGRAHV